MDRISRSRGRDKEIPHCVLPMEQLVLSDKWARISCLQERILYSYTSKEIAVLHGTVKPDLGGHSKIDKTKVLKPCGSLMQVKSIAQEHSAILLTYIKRLLVLNF